MLVKYNANNSGGNWWLKDEDWFALEKAGWKVDWKKDEAFYQTHGLINSDGRYLGALATSAEKQFETPGAAMREFEDITGQSVDDEGCNCCGAPHNFSWGEGDKFGYASGENCLQYMYKRVPKSLRDASQEEIE